MPSVEELLSQDSDDEYMDISPINDIITIDPETRTINLPASETLFGTEQEMDVERKYFKCPKIVGDNIDLSKHQIYIMYITAQDSSGVFLPGEGSEPYYCKDMAVDETGNYITFSWLLSGNVLSKAGFIAFAVCAKHMDGGVLKTRWKTKPSVGTVLLTVPDGASQIVDVYPDIIAQLLERMDAVEEIVANAALEDLPNEYYMLTSGTKIPGNANMDTYKTPGNYYCESNANAATLQNSPFPIAFTLKVEYSNGTGYPMQTYRVWNSGEKAVRVSSHNAWGVYEYFSSDDALVTEKEFDALYTSEKTIVGAINSLMQPITSLTSRDNLNNITTPGRYTGGGSYVPNSPFSGSYDLEVISTTDGIAQSFFCIETGERAFRLKTDGAWSEYAYFRADSTVFDQVEQAFPGWVEDKPITSLETADRTVVGGINELLNSIGVLMGLKTDAKTNLVSAINELVDNMVAAGTDDAHLNVGGRNLLLNTGDPIDGFTTYQGSSFSRSNVSVPGWNTEKAVRFSGTSGTSAVCVLYGKGSYILSIEGQKYVTSVYVKNNHASKNVIVNSNIKTQLTDPVVIEPGETKRAVLFSRSLGTAGLQINFSAEAANTEFDFSVWHMQIEEGDVVSNWTPAPEDYENDIQDAVENTYYLTGGTAIPQNANMDTYLAPGNFYCDQNATAATLQNAPFTNAFTLKVIYGTGSSYPMQIYRQYDSGNVAVRYYSYGSKIWSGYYYYSDDNRLVSLKNFSNLQTTAKTIVGAINEVNAKAGSGGGGSVIDKQVFAGTKTVTSGSGVQIQNAISFRVKGSGTSGTDKSQGTALITVNGGGIYYLTWTSTNDILDAKLSMGAAFPENIASIDRDGANIIVRFTEAITHAISVFQ